MVIITRAIVGLTASGGGLEFVCECGCPLFPGEMPLLRELDGERECLGLPGLGKHRPLCISRQVRRRWEAQELWNRIRLAQGNRPTDRDRQHHAARPARPRAHARRSAPSTRAAATMCSPCMPE